MSQVFLSYSRDDDEPFVKQLYEDLTKNGINVWWDREKMESRGRTFLQELRDAIDDSDHLIAIIGPNAVESDYVKVEWKYALLFAKVVVPILRIGDYDLLKEDKLKVFDIPSELAHLHCPDFRRGRQYDESLKELLRILSKPVPELGPFLTSIPSLPPNHLIRIEYLYKLNKLIMDDIQRPVITTSTKHITALQGMGGIGKSVLAATVTRATEVRKAFYDGILWVTIGSNKPDPIEGMRLIGREFGDDPANYSSQEEAEASLTRVLSDKVCLIVLDDVWKVIDATPYINALGPRCRLLITTRNDDIVTSLGAQKCKIDELSEPDSFKLMADWCEEDVNSLPPEAKDVAKECGYLPLALAVCGAMAKSEITWSSILEALKEADIKYLEAQFPNYPCPNVWKALKISVDFLSSEECEEEYDSVQLYQELAIFPKNEFVPEAAIATLWAYTENLKRRDVEKLLTKLRDRSLLRLDGKAPFRKVSLHDLQLDFLIDKVKFDKVDLSYLHNQLLDAYSQACGNEWNAGPKDGYFFEHLAFHLVGAGRKEELRKILLDFKWIQSKLNATDVYFLINDYDFFQADYPANMVKGAIQLSANALSRDKKLLDGQLLGRLNSFPEIEIKLLLEDIWTYKKNKRILPLTGSLIPPGGTLIRTLSDNSSRIFNAVSVTPDGNYVVAVSAGRLNVFDLKTGLKIHILEYHAIMVTDVSVTPDGNFVVSGSTDNTLKVWDLKAGKEVHTLIGHSGSVNAISVTPNGNYVISASEDCTLKVWDLKAGKEVHTLIGHSSSVGAVSVTSDGNYAVSASSDNTFRVWDLKAGKEVRTLNGCSTVRRAFSVTPDGNFAVSASDDCTLKVWDLKAGKEIHTLFGHYDEINAVSITPDGNYAISASFDGMIKVWDFRNGNEAKTLIHSSVVTDIAITSDGNYVISTSDDIKVWNIKLEDNIHTLTGHSKKVRAVSVTPDGNYAISASEDCTLKVWDLKTRKEVHTLRGHFAEVEGVSVTSDSNYAVSLSDIRLKVWDLKAGKEVHTLIGHNGKINSVSITPDGNYAISASDDYTLKVWDLKNGSEVYTLIGHSSFVNAVAVTSDGNYAISASEDRKLIKWDLKTGEDVRTFSGHINEVNIVSVTPDGNYAVSVADDAILIVWDLKTGNAIYILGNNCIMSKVLSVTPDGNYSVSTSHHNTLKVLDLKNGKEIHILRGHNGHINSVAITSDGNYVVSASDDCTLKVWDLKSGEEVSTFCGESPFLSVIFSPDNTIIVAGERSGRVHFLLF